jgi:hypothetical protein
MKTLTVQWKFHGKTGCAWLTWSDNLGQPNTLVWDHQVASVIRDYKKMGYRIREIEPPIGLTFQPY